MINIKSNEDVENNFLTRSYKNSMLKHMKKVFDNVDESKLESIINKSIIENIDNPSVEVVNSYKGKTANSDLLNLGNYIDKNKPILTASGVLFKNHLSEEKSVLPEQFKRFITTRDELKSTMFTFPEGTYEYELYDLLQSLAKIDGNSLYGMIGLSCSSMFNHDIASSITLNGRALISIVGCQIEMFMNNNVKFEDINDVINLFDEVDNDLFGKDFSIFYKDNICITQDQVYNKIYDTIRDNITGWIPNKNEDIFIRRTLESADQDVLNMLYYKNNLFEFMKVPTIKNLLIDIYTNIENPFINPHKPPKEIKGILDKLYNYIYDFVYYKRIINNSILKYSNMIRSVNIITDTDSCIVCFNNWVELLKDFVKGYHMNSSASYIPYDVLIEGELHGFEKHNYPYQYDYKNDKLIENPKLRQLPSYKNNDGIRYTLLNIGSYILGNIINDYVDRFVGSANAYLSDVDNRCIMVLKNEFLMKRILITDAKKLYASVIELREGEISNNKLDIKGLQIGKSTSNERIRKELKDMLFNLVLNANVVDYKEIIDQMSVLKYQIKENLQLGEKDFYNPIKVKSLDSYDQPYSTQGVKGMILWNVLKDETQSPFNFNEMNYLDNVKLSINPDILKERYPDKYKILVDYLKSDDMFTKGESNIDKVIKGISSISVPKNESIPKFLTDFINYNTVVNDNLSKMPIEHIGIHQHDKNSVTNIISL